MSTSAVVPTHSSDAPAVMDKHMHQFGMLYVNIRGNRRPVTSDAVYASHYTSSIVEKDVFVSRLSRFRYRARGLFRRGPDPDEMRGRRRFRDWEY
ncbi:hypothetical protein VP1G_10665 [Cytospora mali]|uniref:Uncharacterized protein n=1 Tax=Cytospora mali TaxID=578113 RepID=A0A194US01_CYTMA|nr:hypothetical protein VP1G_10665 [Valsa mali var. pyri (nom. inval.)]